MATLWPFLPLKQSREYLSFQTDLHDAYSASSRVSLRPARLELEYSYNLHANRFAEMKQLYAADPLALFEVPVWNEASVAGAVADTDTLINCDTDAEYEDGGRVLIYQGCDAHVAADISVVAPGQLALTAPVGQTFANALAIPLKTAQAPGGLQQGRQARRFYSASLRFLCQDMPDHAATTLPQYLGADYVKCAGVVIEPLSGSVRQLAYTIDNGYGPVVVEPQRDVTEKRFMMTLVSDTPALRWQRKQWLHHMRGRDNEFWFPSWGGGLSLVDPVAAVDTSILIKPLFDSLTDYVGRHVWLDDTAIREITAAVDDGGNHRLTITAPGLAIPVETNVHLISRGHLDTDRVTIDHQRGFVAETTLPIMETTT